MLKSSPLLFVDFNEQLINNELLIKKPLINCSFPLMEIL